MLAKIEDREKKGRQRMRWLDGITETMDMSFSKLHKTVKDTEVWCVAFAELQRFGHDFTSWPFG